MGGPMGGPPGPPGMMRPPGGYGPPGPGMQGPPPPGMPGGAAPPSRQAMSSGRIDPTQIPRVVQPNQELQVGAEISTCGLLSASGSCAVLVHRNHRLQAQQRLDSVVLCWDALS